MAVDSTPVFSMSGGGFPADSGREGKHARLARELAASPAGEASLGWPPCYEGYFRLFNAGEYYPAHDVLEHIWLEAGPPLDSFYKGLIQLAGAFVHLRLHREAPHHRVHGRRLGPAARLLRRSRELLRPYEPVFEGLDVAAVRELARQTLVAMGDPPHPVNPWQASTRPCLPPLQPKP